MALEPCRDAWHASLRRPARVDGLGYRSVRRIAEFELPDLVLECINDGLKILYAVTAWQWSGAELKTKSPQRACERLAEIIITRITQSILKLLQTYAEVPKL